MATFIDRHLAEAMPREAFIELLRDAEEQHVDSDGVRVLGHWLGDGHLYCLLQAPHAEAARQHHAARGLACDDIRQIKGGDVGRSGGYRPGVVRAAVETFWPSASH